MSDIPEMVPAPPALLVATQVLECDVFIYIIQTDVIIHFRRKGDELSIDDVQTLSKMAPDHVLVPRAQLDAIAPDDDASTEIDLKRPPPIVSPKTPDQVTVDFLRSLVREAAATADRLLKVPAENRSLGFAQVIREGDANEEPLLTHLRRVCGVAVLIQLSTHSDPQDITDLAVAGMIHDVGLFLEPEAVQVRHVSGTDLVAEGGKPILSHIEETLGLFERFKLPLNPTVTRTIQHHHENWDGSGPKGMRLSQIYRPARILRVAEDLATVLAASPGQDVAALLQALSAIVGESGEPIYDPSLMGALVADLSSGKA